MRKSLLGLIVAVLIPLITLGQTPPDFNLINAKTYFDECRGISNADGSKLWGRPLYGPLLFVDQQSHTVIANQQDPRGLLHADGGLFQGTLEGINPTNDDVEWAGTHWTMIVWQLIPEDRLSRKKLFAHEMFHRIQQDLHLRAQASLNQHLDSEEGRIWLRLEWRALAAALISHGHAQEQAVKDALTFRNHRRRLFSGAAETERSLEIAEGVAEYTGLVSASPNANSAKWFAVAQLAYPDLTKTFVRAFAYTSGPAYGLLLDDRQPGWRKKLSEKSDLGQMLASTIKGPLDSAVRRAPLYGLLAIRDAEKDRATKIESIKARYRKLLVDGPLLILPHTENTKITFNPSALITLDEKSVVYPTLKVIASWGAMEITDGALLQHGSKQITVTAPKKPSGLHLEGSGWTLNLNEGWEVVPSDQQGNYLVRKVQ
jgi:hypothetical protein